MVMPMDSNRINEEAQKASYNIKKYRTPDGAPADIVMFTLTKRERKTVTKTLPIRELKVMLIKRRSWPLQDAGRCLEGFVRKMNPCMELPSGSC